MSIRQRRDEDGLNHELTETHIWRKYRQGVDHHSRLNLYANTEKAFRFFEGDQWNGVSNADELPVYNFIAPTVEYKTAMVSMQQMQIVYSPHDTAAGNEAERICADLNEYARRHWEAQKMDYLCWKIVRDACIAGDSYVYFYNRNLDVQVIDNTAVYLADEQQPDIQKQAYIVLYERRPVADVRRDAKQNGLKKDQIELITPDEDSETVVGDATEVANDGKCSCLLYLYRADDGEIHIVRSTKTVIYQPDSEITGLRKYPIASFVWIPKKNSARGTGEVVPIIPNQIEANKLLARRLISAKMNAFAKPVYVKNMIENPADVDNVGKAIAVKTGSVQSVHDVFTYIAPAPMSQEAGILQTDIIQTTRDLAGAGDAALGQVNPERASGAAIIAVQDQAAIPLNEQIAMFKQFIEDVALIWIEMWRAYNPNGLTITMKQRDGMIRKDTIEPEALDELRLQVRIDASPTNPFSKYAREQALENARAGGSISFEEYVEALPEDATAPKAAFQAILEKRSEAAAQMPAIGGGAGVPGGLPAGMGAMSGAPALPMEPQGPPVEAPGGAVPAMPMAGA